MYEINIQTTIIWFWSTVGGTRCWAPKQIGNFFAWSFYATAFGINNVDEEIFFVFSFYPLLFSILLYNNGKKVCIPKNYHQKPIYYIFFFFLIKLCADILILLWAILYGLFKLCVRALRAMRLFFFLSTAAAPTLLVRLVNSFILLFLLHFSFFFYSVGFFVFLRFGMWTGTCRTKKKNKSSYGQICCSRADIHSHFNNVIQLR